MVSLSLIDWNFARANNYPNIKLSNDNTCEVFGEVSDRECYFKIYSSIMPLMKEHLKNIFKENILN